MSLVFMPADRIWTPHLDLINGCVRKTNPNVYFLSMSEAIINDQKMETTYVLYIPTYYIRTYILILGESLDLCNVFKKAKPGLITTDC